MRSTSYRQGSLFEQKGLPIGNLTSQLFANIYLNKFDYFVKHKLKVRNYLRYTDDFVIVDDSKGNLLNLLPKIKQFLAEKLKLEVHPNKISTRKFRQGIDFLGCVVLPKHKQIRSKTKQRIFKKLKLRVGEHKAGLIARYTLEQSLNSYLGILSHADTRDLQNKLKNHFWFWLKE